MFRTNHAIATTCVLSLVVCFTPANASVGCGESAAFTINNPLVLYVDASATGPTHDGTSWCSAYLYLQDALAAAGAGDEIRVADGTYTPDRDTANPSGTGDRAATFQLKNGLTINGGYAGCGAPDPDARDISANETILSGNLAENDAPVACTQDSPDCDSNGRLCVDGACIIPNGNGENSYHVVTGSDTDDTAVLVGFTVTAGNAEPSQDNNGGGMWNDAGSPTVRNCTFMGNYGTSGGGMSNWNGSNPEVTSCTFSGNSATHGGGMYNVSSSPTLDNCTFEWNSAEGGGGGMTNNSSTLTLTGCAFIMNTATSLNISDGGGMFNEESNVTLMDSVFSGNTASDAGGGVHFGAGGSLSLTNCLFEANTAGRGGGLYINTVGSVALLNCTFAGNSCPNGGSALWCNSSGTSVIEISNSILQDGGDEISGGGACSISVTYSCIEGCSAGAGGFCEDPANHNIGDDPMFVRSPDPGPDGSWDGVDDDYGDSHLQAGSPCIDAGDNSAVTKPTDLDGNPRIVDGDGDDTATVDMGAYYSDTQ